MRLLIHPRSIGGIPKSKVTYPSPLPVLGRGESVRKRMCERVCAGPIRTSFFERTPFNVYGGGVGVKESKHHVVILLDRRGIFLLLPVFPGAGYPNGRCERRSSWIY
jgi:hypothetical protein